MKFITEIKVRFGQTDPAGIVFYPRYFEMINQVVEDWFEALDFDFRTIHIVRAEAVPLVHIDVDFKSASRLGDLLRFELEVERLGRSSISLHIVAFCASEQRLVAKLALAYVRKDPIGSIEIPAFLRARLMAFAPEGDAWPDTVTINH